MYDEICSPSCRAAQVAARARPLLRRTSTMDEPRDDLRNEDGTVPKWARRVTDTFASNGVQDSKHRDLIDSIEAAEKATNGVFSSKSAGGILDLNAYREMEEEDRAAMNQEQLRRNAEVAQLAALRAEKDRLDEEAARARIKAATDEAMATAPKRKSDANAPFKLVKVAKKKPIAAKEQEDDAGGLEGLLGGYGSDDSNDADADQSAPGPPPPPTTQTVPPPPPHQPEAAPAGVPGADEYHSDNELDVARAAEARRLREAAEEAEEIAAAMARREEEARARARVQDIYQQERAIRDEEAAERARTHQSIVPEGSERVAEEEREGARGRNSNERRRGRRSPSSRSRGSESDSPPGRERRHRRSRSMSRSRSRDRRDDRDRDDIRDRERRRRRSRSRGGSGSRERRRRSSPRDAEYWTRHYSEKFGLDDGDTGRGGGKGVDEWAKYYEQKYGLSK